MNMFHHRRWRRPVRTWPFRSVHPSSSRKSDMKSPQPAPLPHAEASRSEADMWRDASDWVRNQVVVTFRHKAILSRLEPVMHGVANVDLTDRMLVIVLPNTIQNRDTASRSSRSNSHSNKETKRRCRSSAKQLPPSCSCTLVYPSSLLSPDFGDADNAQPTGGDVVRKPNGNGQPNGDVNEVRRPPCAACNICIDDDGDCDIGDTSFHSRTSAQIMVEKVRARIKLLEDMESKTATVQRRKWSIWPPSVSQSLSRKTNPTNPPSEVGTEVTRSSSPRWKASMVKKTDNDTSTLSHMVLTPASS